MCSPQKKKLEITPNPVDSVLPTMPPSLRDFPVTHPGELRSF